MAKSMDMCTCGPKNFIWMIIGVIVMGIGLWFLIGGLQVQWTGSASWQLAISWYAIGFLIMALGKMAKHKGCGYCPAHSMMK